VIDIRNINFHYPGEELFTITDINLKISSGEFVAIVGPSGAGKTTLVDLMLGVINPSSGKITISGENPADAIRKWPGAIGYIPQNIEIIDGSIKSNIALGFPESAYFDELFESAITISQMKDFTQNLPKGLETEVGEKGSRISGGQRQRLGIARSLYTKPRILVMDEATSLLDGKTESNLTQAIQMLRGDVTLVTIAHRLSTIINADKVVYMNNGRIEAVGTFQEVKAQVPDFEEQAHLMGL
jgi:ABC-type bacteriocin/lantibiotic exporter with double-glycine peptidase domain